jgi:anthranilate 1,2-dioxygenase large subunit/terephthalate 1,2-dioxygenase oxygenase component alpha subunit
MPFSLDRSNSRTWPAEGVTRVPYWVYSDPEVYAREQERVFRGDTWSYLCLEAELPGPNTWLRASLGEMPVVVTRDDKGTVHAFENRCAHRGALICLKERGKDRRLTCVYHNWTYDLEGNLQGVAFRRGIGGKGGMPDTCKPEEQAPRKLRVGMVHGLVFGSLSETVPPVEAYIGPEVVARIARVMRGPVRVLGSYSQIIPSNWKLYVENVKDVYHASLLHTFFTTFRLNRLTQKGGIIISQSGGSHASYSQSVDSGEREYEKAGMRAAKDGLELEAPEIFASVDEVGDGVGIQILGVFPSLVLHQIRNSLATRRVVPKGVDRMELVWTLFGFESDDAAMTERRLLQSNLVGPSGYVSMEDGAAPGFVRRVAPTADGCLSVIEMGGSGYATTDDRLNEAPVRGMWAMWRSLMQI